MTILATVARFVEKASRPGLLGVPGRALEIRAQKEVRAYFKGLGSDLLALDIADKFQDVSEYAASKDRIRHAVEIRVHATLKRHQPLLKAVLEQNGKAAYELSYKMTTVQEADENDDQGGIDKLGPSGQEAADWAAANAAEQVVGVDQTTIDLIADSVADGIEQRLGVPGTSRLIRDAVDGMAKTRADMIATTEMNRAMSTAALAKMDDLGVEYKQIIIADDDACDICQGNADQDPIPVDDTYDSGDDAPPFHPNCRCAITGARPPDQE